MGKDQGVIEQALAHSTLIDFRNNQTELTSGSFPGQSSHKNPHTLRLHFPTEIPVPHGGFLLK